jgi:hypothetical protein
LPGGGRILVIPVTNTSVNPTRSTGPALIVGGWARQQLWLFWIPPLLAPRPQRRISVVFQADRCSWRA